MYFQAVSLKEIGHRIFTPTMLKIWNPYPLHEGFYVHKMPAHFFKTVKIVTLATFELVFTRCRFQSVPVRLAFSNLLLSKSAGKKCAVSCEREAYPSHFTLFSKCAGIM